MSLIHGRIDKAISQYAVAFMNNTKWKVVFEQICAEDLSFAIAYVREHNYGIMQKIITLRLEDRYIADGCLIGGPVSYKEIYSLKIERFKAYRDSVTGAECQDNKQSTAFINSLNKLGKYPLELTKKHIYINGYK